MKHKMVYALLIIGILAGCTIPCSIAFAEDNEPGQTDQTDDTTDQPTDGDGETETPGDGGDEEQPAEDDPFSDPDAAGVGNGSGNNDNTPAADPTPSDPIQGTTPVDTDDSNATYVPGEIITEDTTNTNSSQTTTTTPQVHRPGTTDHTSEDSADVTAVDEQIEASQDQTEDDSIEVPHTGAEEDGMNMLAVGLLLIAGTTIIAAAAIVILMNKLAKKAEADLK